MKKKQIIRSIYKRLVMPKYSPKIFEELCHLTATLELIENFELKLLSDLDVD